MHMVLKRIVVLVNMTNKRKILISFRYMLRGGKIFNTSGVHFLRLKTNNYFLVLNMGRCEMTLSNFCKMIALLDDSYINTILEDMRIDKIKLSHVSKNLYLSLNMILSHEFHRIWIDEKLDVYHTGYDNTSIYTLNSFFDDYKFLSNDSKKYVLSKIKGVKW